MQKSVLYYVCKIKEMVYQRKEQHYDKDNIQREIRN